MTKTVLEADLRHILRDVRRFPSGTVSFCEFARGGDAGLPDCWLAGRNQWLPLELKRGGSVLKGLRPTQHAWHRDSLELGIKTWGLTIASNTKKVLLFEFVLVNGQLNEALLQSFEPQDVKYSTIVAAIPL